MAVSSRPGLRSSSAAPWLFRLPVHDLGTAAARRDAVLQTAVTESAVVSRRQETETVQVDRVTVPVKTED